MRHQDIKTEIPITLRAVLMVGLVYLLSLQASPVRAGWPEQIQADSLTYGLDVAVTDSSEIAANSTRGDVLVAGKFEGTLTTAEGEVNAVGGDDIFVFRYDALGSFKGFARARSTGGDKLSAIATSREGTEDYLYLAGTIAAGEINFGAHNITVASSRAVVFLAKLKVADMTWKWATWLTTDSAFTCGLNASFDGIQLEVVTGDEGGGIILAGQYTGHIIVDYPSFVMSAEGGNTFIAMSARSTPDLRFVHIEGSPGSYEALACSTPSFTDAYTGITELDGSIYTTGYRVYSWQVGRVEIKKYRLDLAAERVTFKYEKFYTGYPDPISFNGIEVEISTGRTGRLVVRAEKTGSTSIPGLDQEDAGPAIIWFKDDLDLGTLAPENSFLIDNAKDARDFVSSAEGVVYVTGVDRPDLPDSTRTVTWAARIEEGEVIKWHSVSTDSSGGSGAHAAAWSDFGGGENLYITGRFSGETVFGSDSLTSSGGWDGFVTQLDHVGNWYRSEQWVIGDEIFKPNGAETSEPTPVIPNVPADQACENFYWDETHGKYYVVRPVAATLEWPPVEEDDPVIKQRGAADWPVPVPIYHVRGADVRMPSAGTPFSQLHYPIGVEASVTDNTFRRDGSTGYSVLRYGDTNPIFEIVKTVEWSSNELSQATDTCTIGTALTSPLHEEIGRNGWIVNEAARYDGDGPLKAYDRSTRLGPILPVNEDDPDTMSDDMVVVWYGHNAATGVAWPNRPVTYDCTWPPAPDVLKADDSVGGSISTFNDAVVYVQDDPSIPGFNPNDEHAFIAPAAESSSENAVFALRPEGTSASQPYVLLKHRDTMLSPWQMKVYKVDVTATGSSYHEDVTVGDPIPPPWPLPFLGPCPETGGSGAAYWEDVRGQVFTRTDGDLTVQYYYPLRSDFYWDPTNSGTSSGVAGDCVPYNWDETYNSPEAFTYTASYPTDLPVLRIGESLLGSRQDPDGRDLPGVMSRAAVEVIWENSTCPPGGTAPCDQETNLVRLTDPLSPRSVDATGFPEGALDQAPYHLRMRITHDLLDDRLEMKGFLDESLLGDPTLLPNVMTTAERDELEALASCDSACDAAVTDLYNVTRDPRGVVEDGSLQIGLQTDGMGGGQRLRLVGQPAMLTAGGAGEGGIVTLAFNNDLSLDPASNPVELALIKVDCGTTPYLGTLHQMPTDNVFEQRLILRHSGDHGFEPENHTFTWYERRAPNDPASTPDSTPADWQERMAESGLGKAELRIAGQNARTIVDNFVFLNVNDAVCGDRKWIGDPSSTVVDPKPVLAEGWIKRVVRNLNPFKTRVSDFHAGPVNTYASMLIQAGEPYNGAIAFNADPANLNSIGLIEAYETVLRRGKDLTIDSGDVESRQSQAGHEALLLAAGRIADLYMLVGNEAFADAADPTIGFTAESGEYGTLAPAIFAFQNQVPSLLDEELALLRGRDGSGAATNLHPLYNRLIWNFTSGEGEVAYSQIYQISDQSNDGVLDEKDARIQYPQGHGDAWGHYLTGIKGYYQLLRHPEYVWRPRAEVVNVAGTGVTVDYRDERKFAAAAAARAKTGSEITNLTYRKQYLEDTAGQWQGYPDPDADRAWGVDDWARRAGQGAYFDWVVANALLPDQWHPEDRQCALFDEAAGGLPGDDECPELVAATVPDVGKIDRTNTPEIGEIAGHYRDVEARLDDADIGLNPLGLAKGVVPFDIDPSRVDAGETHFEQIYERSRKALANALAVFDHANGVTQSLRRNQDSLTDFTNNVDDKERDFQNRLIEIFGKPYPEDVGAGKTYPFGYDSADVYHYMIVETTDLTGIRTTNTEQITAYYNPMAGFDAWTPAENASPEPAGAILEVLYEFDPSGAGITKLDGWTQRPEPGEIQLTLSDFQQSRIAFERALKEYDNLLKDLEALQGDIEAQQVFGDEQLKILYRQRNRTIAFDALMVAAKSTQLIAKRCANAAAKTTDAAAEAIPKSVGLSSDVLAPARGAVKATGVAVWSGSAVVETIAAISHEALTAAKDVADLGTAIKLEENQFDADLAALQGDLEALLRQETVKRLDVLNQREVVMQNMGKYRAAVGRGLRLLDELIAFRKRTAADVQQYRYQDMTFRVVRNDAIQKYRAQFDLAARYAYLAAVAYDYETNLLGTASGAGEQFLTDIVRHRTLGEMLGGEPVAGSRGLADPLARLGLNFEVLEGQLGFNNPQTETTPFSIRSELLRLRDSSDDGWQRELARYRVDNLWDLPEFRRFCRPFAPESAGPQPGLVIGFDGKGGRPLVTTVTSGLNFFGHALGGGDSAYDPTNFATKIRSVGVWLENYNATGLSNTPRIYLVPVGADILRTPTAGDFGTREWRVIDQVLPVPFPIGSTQLSDPEYVPQNDSMSDNFVSIRRFSSFRAYHDTGGFNPAETTTDSRLIGRSVWNSRWLLIIPGATLLADPEQGLDTFVDQVDDIKLFFQTYAFSGN